LGQKIMKKIKGAALAAGVFLALGATAQAAGELVLGDSFGVGVKAASGRTGPARLSVFIRNGGVLSQFSAVPSGATAFLVIGTNDSAAGIKGIEKNIDDVVRTAEARRIKLIWVGPPCVKKPWDGNAAALDRMLASRLAGTSVKYVSIRDETLCSGVLGGDGVHMSFKGYQYIWNKARIAAGLPDDGSGDKIKVAAAPAAPKPAAPVASPDKPVRVAAAVTPDGAKPVARVKKKRVAARAPVATAQSTGSWFLFWRRAN
jgi:hypothetical protein